MENSLTPEQKLQLGSWASQRDSILQEIAEKRVENEKLIEANKNLALSNTEIANKIQQSIGRLEEITKKEKEYISLITLDKADLISEKSVLQSDISYLKKEIELLKENRSVLIENNETLNNTYNKVFIRVSDTENIIEEVVRINSENAREVENILITAGSELKKVVDINSELVAKTNVVINKLPEIIFDIQRDIMERKTLNRVKTY